MSFAFCPSKKIKIWTVRVLLKKPSIFCFYAFLTPFYLSHLRRARFLSNPSGGVHFSGNRSSFIIIIRGHIREGGRAHRGGIYLSIIRILRNRVVPYSYIVSSKFMGCLSLFLIVFLLWTWEMSRVFPYVAKKYRQKTLANIGVTLKQAFFSFFSTFQSRGYKGKRTEWKINLHRVGCRLKVTYKGGI